MPTTRLTGCLLATDVLIIVKQGQARRAAYSELPNTPEYVTILINLLTTGLVCSAFEPRQRQRENKADAEIQESVLAQ